MTTGRDLVLVARGLFEPGARPMVAPLLRQRREVAGLPRGAKLALEDVLRKGLVVTLARNGARAATSFDGRGGARAGRAWERLSPPSLRVTARSFELIQWLLSEPLGDADAGPLPEVLAEVLPDAGPTLADELLLALAWELLVDVGLGSVAVQQPAFARSGLVWLFGVDVLAGQAAGPTDAAMARWASGEGADLLSCLASSLGRRWARLEADKPTTAKDALALGATQEILLDRLLDAALAAGRPDAATFLLELAERFFPAAGAPFSAAGLPWARAFTGGSPLALRVAARRASIAPLRALCRLAAERDRAQAVRFVDDGYDEAQALVRGLRDWDDGRFERVAEVIRSVETLELEVG